MAKKTSLSTVAAGDSLRDSVLINATSSALGKMTATEVLPSDANALPDVMQRNSLPRNFTTDHQNLRHAIPHHPGAGHSPKGNRMATNIIPPSLAAFDSLPDSALIDVSAYAMLLGCSTNTIWRRSRAKILPAPIRVSSQQTRWRVGDVRKALASLAPAVEC